MLHSPTTTVIIILAGLAGALSVFSPDRWLPTSVLAWQRRWKYSHTLLFLVLAFFSHVLLGYLLFLALQHLGQKMGQTLSMHLESSVFFIFALILMFSIALARRFRFPRIQEVLRVGPKGAWGSLVVFSLLGPCEVIVPIFIKAKFLGVGYLIPFLAFLGGTWIMGILLISLGRNFWDRPLGLPRVLDWAYRGSLSLPLWTGVALSVGFSLI